MGRKIGWEAFPPSPKETFGEELNSCSTIKAGFVQHLQTIDPSSLAEKGIPFSYMFALMFLRAGLGGGVAEGAEEESGILLCMRFVEKELGSIFLFHGPLHPPAMLQQHPDFMMEQQRSPAPSLYDVPGSTYVSSLATVTAVCKCSL